MGSRKTMRLLSAFAAALLLFATLPAQAFGAVAVQVLSVSFDSSGHGLITGGYAPDGGAIRYPFVSVSADGGTVWSPTPGPANTSPFASGALAASGGVGAYFNGATTIRTVDSGASWASAGTLPGSGVSIYGSDFGSASTGWAVGTANVVEPGAGTGGAIFTTSNGGVSWTLGQPVGPVQPPDVNGNPVPTYAELRGVDGANAMTAWAVGSERVGSSATIKQTLIYKTGDGGATWDPQGPADGGKYQMYAVSAVDSQIAFMVGRRNVVYRTTDGGVTWSLVMGPTSALNAPVLHGVSFASSQVGWTVGSTYTGVGTLYKTTDGGTTWVSQAGNLASAVGRLRAVRALSTTEAVIVGDNEAVLRTVDGGTTWTGSYAQAAPTASVAAPISGAVLTGTAATVSIAATDTGVGVSGAQVTIRRSDARYWNGTGWQTDARWLGTSRTAVGSPWTYPWALESSQDRNYAYSIGWRAWDGLENTATVVDAATNVRVDNLGPALVNAFQTDATHVQATFSEPLALGSAVAARFTLDGGLTVGGAQVITATPTGVLLSTTAQTPGTDYTLSVTADAVDDVYGNVGRSGTDAYRATMGVPVPFLTVAQGTDPGRPATQTIVAPGAVAVVDEVLLSAHDGSVTVTALSVAGTPTATFAADVATVSAVADTDRDGTLSAADTTLASVPAGPGTLSLTFGSPSVVASGTSLPVWIVYRLASGATDDRSAGSRVTSASAGSRVETFSPIVSAASGRTLRIDALSPSVTLSSPSSNATLTGGSHNVAGTLSDSVGVDGLSLAIRRSDGNWWTGVAWSPAKTWLAVAPTSNWTYGWTLDAGQNTEHTYSVDVTVTDFVGRTASTGVTGVRVDNSGPALVYAYEADSTHVRAVFSEALGPVIPDTGKFALTGGVTVDAASAVGGSEVLLTTSDHSVGTTYTLSVAPGAVADVYGNASQSGADEFLATDPGPFVTVAQGTDPGRPSAPAVVLPGSRAVVDELVFSAHSGAATVTAVTVVGTSTGSFASDVATVSLVADTDRDGTLSAADTTLASVAAAAVNTLTLSSTIASGSSLPVWIVCRLASGAVDTNEIGSRITSVTTTRRVESFPTLVSAAGGRTLVVDAVAPSVALTSPSAGAVLTGSQVVVSGTATDTVGLQSLGLSIRRSDAKWWTGLGWSSSEAWIPVTPGSAWTYAWDLDAGEDGRNTFDVTARVLDRAGRSASAVVGGVAVDNTGPALETASESSYDGVRASFSETVAAGSIVATGFTLDGGLTVEAAASVPGSPADVRLSTPLHAKGTAYTLSVASGAVRDVHGNAGRSGSRGFTAVADGPFLTAAQGLGAGRPTTGTVVTRGARAVVDEVVVTAHIGSATVTGLRVSGLSGGSFSSVVSTVTAIEDTDRNGALSSADATLATASAAASMTLTFGTPRALSADATLPVWLVYRVSGTAPDAAWAGSQITSVSASSRVDPIPAIVSAGSPAGRTLVVDADAPQVTLSAPTGGSTLTGAAAVLSGTAIDTVGIASLDVSIRRSDGMWWTGAAWTSSQTWVGVSPGVAWTYDWSLDANQNGTSTYALTARVTDLAGAVATAGVTGVRVDNLEPALLSAAYVDTTHVDLTFSESLDPASVLISQFAFAGQVETVTAVSPSGATVHLTTTEMAYSTSYVVQTGTVLRDLAGNATGESSEAGFVSGSAPPRPPVYEPPPYVAPVTPALPGHTLYTPVAPSTVYYGRTFTISGLFKPRHKAGLYSVKLEGYRYERQSNGTYKWVRRATWYAKNYDYSTYTKYIKTGAVIRLRGKWRVRAVHSHTGYLPKYSGYRYLTVR